MDLHQSPTSGFSKRVSKYTVRAGVRRHIQSLPENTLFTTRELLNYGKRSSVDSVLSKMVKEELIVRVARGMFMRFNERLAHPSILEIARKKAESFYRSLCAHGSDLAAKFKLIESGNPEITFHINGRTSSFQVHTLEIRVHLRGTSCRRVRNPDTPVGDAIRAIWERGKKAFEPQHIMIVTREFFRQDRALLRQSADLMPSWMWDSLKSGLRPSKPRVSRKRKGDGEKFQDQYSKSPDQNLMQRKSQLSFSEAMTELEKFFGDENSSQPEPLKPS